LLEALQLKPIQFLAECRQLFLQIHQLNDP
jgi:hypothetical protein